MDNKYQEVADVIASARVELSLDAIARAITDGLLSKEELSVLIERLSAVEKDV